MDCDISCDFTGNGFQVTSSYVLGLSGEQLSEYSGGASAPVSAWLRSNVFLPGGLAVTYYGTDTYFALNDWLGTRRGEVSAGGCLSTWTGLAFGNGINQQGACTGATEFHFTGKERDPESALATNSGNDYFGARYYSSTLGRWLSPDWSAKEEPVPYSQFQNPQSLNLYGYEGNNPLSKADKDGHCWPVCTVLAGAVVGALTGGAIETSTEYFATGKVNWSKVENAAVGGLVTGAIVGAAGPEAGLAAKAVLGVVGSVAGGAFERGINGEKVGNAKAIAVDAAAGVISPKIEAVADRTFSTEAISKTVSGATDATIDAGRRMSDNTEQSQPSQSQPQSQSQPSQEPQQPQHKTCSTGSNGCN